MFGSAKYRNYHYGADDHIAVVHTEKLTRFAAIFITSAIHKTSFNGQFNYGRNFYAKDADDLIIQLPTKNESIDFEFMESVIAELEQRRFLNLQAYLQATGLDNYDLTNVEERVLNEYNKIQWGTFRMGDLFDRVKTKKLPYKAEELSKEPIGAYTLPCLTSSFKNQGLNYFAPREEATTIKNVISIPSNSDVYRAYFQSTDFTVLSDAYAIKWILNDKDLTPNQYLFAVQAINKVTDLPIYSYKNKLGGWNVVKEKYIQLPIKNNEPDLVVMNNLTTALKKLAIKDVVQYTKDKLTTA